MTMVRTPKKETWRELFSEVFSQTGGPPTAAERRTTRKELGMSERKPSSYMTVKTAYEKIAISLPSRAAEHVRRAVRRGEAASASAYIADAIEQKAKKETWQELFADIYAETGGPPSATDLRDARRRLGLLRRKARGKKR